MKQNSFNMRTIQQQYFQMLIFLFHCNYDVKDIPIRSQFYTELLQWWSEFRFEFDGEKKWQNVIWNNKDIPINNKSIFYKNFFESGIIYVKDLLLKLNNIDSYNVILNIINKTNFLVWAGLRHAVPYHPFPSGSPKIGPIGPINSKRRRRIALFPINVKFGTMRDYIFSQ